MAKTTISDQLCSELIQFLDNEAVFLTGVEKCVQQIGRLPVGKYFSEDLADCLESIHADISGRNLQRATLQSQLAQQLGIAPGTVRLSALEASPEMTKRLQAQRNMVLQKALSLEFVLRIVLGQLSDSNVIVTAVLESVFGSPVDRSRYDQHGKALLQVSRIDGQRVA